MRNLPEKDWKLFKQKLPGWQESYMTRLCEEYMELLKTDKKGSERFWELDQRIKEDRKKTGVVAMMTRSKLLINLVNLVADGTITMDDLEEFSDDAKEAVRSLLRW